MHRLEDPLHRHETGEPANSKPKEQTMSDESNLKSYTVIGVYAEDDQRFVVAGNVVMADAATHIPG
jgi:hypothetical protein